MGMGCSNNGSGAVALALALAWQPISIPARFLKANLAQAAHFFAHFMLCLLCNVSALFLAPGTL